MDGGMDLECTNSRTEAFEGSIGLRIGGIFILWASSTVVTLFPIVTRRVSRFHVPQSVYDFAKYFGSGVIIATAFIHLLAPGVEELHNPCLSKAFQDYDAFPFAFAMISMFAVFVVELFAFRLGTSMANNLAHDPSIGGHHHAIEHANHHQAPDSPKSIERSSSDKALDKAESQSDLSSEASEILGIAILEFGVIFHSIIIGITLGTTSDFNILFVVIIFHQMFEGLGLGSRLAYIPLKATPWIPYVGAIAYGLVTPIGLAIGLGVRHSYNEESPRASYVTGVFDSVSAGILLYTGLVELLAHEFIFNEKMRKAPTMKVVVSVLEMLLGAGLMALLGRWA